MVYAPVTCTPIDVRLRQHTIATPNVLSRVNAVENRFNHGWTQIDTDRERLKETE